MEKWATTSFRYSNFWNLFRSLRHSLTLLQSPAAGNGDDDDDDDEEEEEEEEEDDKDEGRGDNGHTNNDDG